VVVVGSVSRRLKSRRYMFTNSPLVQQMQRITEVCTINIDIISGRWSLPTISAQIRSPCLPYMSTSSGILSNIPSSLNVVSSHTSLVLHCSDAQGDSPIIPSRRASSQILQRPFPYHLTGPDVIMERILQLFLGCVRAEATPGVSARAKSYPIRLVSRDT
jgi:hypothetical protein